MRFSLTSRRRRRWRSPYSYVLSCLNWASSSTPPKHIKIDDEERLIESDDYQPYPIGQRPASSRMAKMLFLGFLALLIFAVSVVYIIYKPPNMLIKFFQMRWPDVLFHVDLRDSQKVVALTLDDAPSSETGKILDLLKTYGAKATFFVIGSQVSSREEILERIHDEGHELGNHAWADEPSVSLPPEELEQQIKMVESLIPVNKNKAKYFRPGSGFFNKKMVENVKTLGYRVCLGSVYPHDPQVHSPSINAKHVLSMVRPGSVIVMHDRRSYSYEQIELVLKGLKNGGWKIESIGGLLELSEQINGKKNPG